MKIDKYLKILSRDEYFGINIDDDSISCIYLVDNYNAKSFIWTIEDEMNSLQSLSNLSLDKKYPRTLIDALLRTPRMRIDDNTFNLILKANIHLLESINKRDFLNFIQLYEWII